MRHASRRVNPLGLGYRAHGRSRSRGSGCRFVTRRRFHRRSLGGSSRKSVEHDAETAAQDREESSRRAPPVGSGMTSPEDPPVSGPTEDIAAPPTSGAPRRSFAARLRSPRVAHRRRRRTRRRGGPRGLAPRTRRRRILVARADGRDGRRHPAAAREPRVARRASGLLARAEGERELRADADGERQGLRPLPAERRPRRLRQAVPDRRDVPVSRRVSRRSKPGGARRGARRRGSPAEASPCSTSGYPQSVHIAYPGVDYQVEVYDPTAGSRNAARLARAARALAACSSAGGRRARAPAPTRGVGRRAGGRRAVARSPDLLGRAAAGLHLRADAHDGRQGLHPLPAARHARRRPEGELPDRCHLSLPERLRRGRSGRRAGPRRSRSPHGGIAVVDGAYPKSIHLAYPGRELPGRGLRPVSEQPAASSSPPARSPRFRSPGRPARSCSLSPGSSFRSSSCALSLGCGLLARARRRGGASRRARSCRPASPS